LVERSPKEIAQVIKKRVEAVKAVRDCHQVSVRISGKRFDVDMHISLDNNLRFEDVHKIASDVEVEVKRMLPHSRITIHTEPIGKGREDLRMLIKGVAESVPGSRGVHNVHIQEIGGRLCVDLHLEVSAEITVKQAHEVSNQVEQKLKESKLNISDITVHMESASDLISRELTGTESELQSYVEDLVKGYPEIKSVHGIRIRKIGGHLHLVLRCHFDPNINMEQAHALSSNIEKAIKGVFPNIDRIDIHEEPA
jgi:divalent metal cation (Fe/Co/Zn/Cd) transporter